MRQLLRVPNCGRLQRQGTHQVRQMKQLDRRVGTTEESGGTQRQTLSLPPHKLMLQQIFKAHQLCSRPQSTPTSIPTSLFEKVS